MSRRTPLVEVTRKCGHVEELRVAGPLQHRPGIIAELAQQECSACAGWPTLH